MLGKHEPELPVVLRPNLPAEAAPFEPRIEVYLDEVCASFHPGLSEEKRRELRKEMRVHLEERVAANVELGDTPEEAIAGALQQFGESQQVGRAWQQERRATLLMTGVSVRQSARFALLLYIPTGMLALFLLQVIKTMVLGMVAGYMTPESKPMVESLCYATAFLLPIPAGLLTGLLAQRRAAGTVFRTLCLLAVLMAAYYALRPPFGQSPFQGASAMLCSVGLFWVPIGTASAGIGGWLRKQTIRLKQRLALR